MLLTFEFQNIEEAQEFLKGLTAGRQPSTSVVPEPSAAAVGPSKDSPAKRGRKPKEAPLPSEPAAAPAPTIDDVRTALSDVMGKLGTQAASDVLARNGVKRVGELLPAQYPQVIVDCAQACANA